MGLIINKLRNIIGMRSKALTDADIKTLSELAAKYGSTEASEVMLPVVGGRSSISEASTNGLLSTLGIIDPDIPLKYLEAMDYLAKWDGDFSYAVDNIVQLGNTDFSVTFDDGVSDTMSKDMHDELKRFFRGVYNGAEGVSALIGDLMAQMAISGALSSEIVPSDNLDGVSKVVLVHPKSIVFKYDKEEDKYIPYQKLPNGVIGARVDGLKELNTITYKYYALRRLNDKPYAIPPMLASLESIQVEKAMFDSIKTIVDKLGMMGFLQVLVNPPAREPKENVVAYQARCQKYIQSIVPELEKGLKKGYVAGFNGTHKFEMQNVSTNVNGTDAIFTLNSKLKMSGLKQDPLMLGRNYSTTETIGRVILAKLTKQVNGYQKTVASFLTDVFTMHLMLRGFKFSFLEVEFEEPMVSDRLRDMQVRTAEINNYDMLYKQGVITQQQRANALGYEEAAEEAPLDITEVVESVEEDDDSTNVDEKTTKVKSQIKHKLMSEVLDEMKTSLGGDGEEFDYHLHNGKK